MKRIIPAGFIFLALSLTEISYGQELGSPNCMPTTTVDPVSMEIVGNYLYTGHWGGGNPYKSRIGIYDISVPGSFTFVAEQEFETTLNGSILDLEDDGTYMYGCSRYGENFYIWDYSTPTSLTLVGQVGAGTFLDPMALKPAGTVVYVADGDHNQLAVVDVSTPSTPTIIGTTTGLGFVSDVDYSGTIVYVASTSGLQIIDASTPSSPSLLTTVTDVASYWKVHVKGTYLYASNGADIYTYDISTPSTPALQGVTNLSATIGEITDNGSELMVGTQSAGTGAVTLLDITDPASPAIAYETTGLSYSPNSLVLSDGFIYTADNVTDKICAYGYVGPPATCPVDDQTANTADFSAVCHVDTSIGIDSSQNMVYYFLRNDADDAIVDVQVGDNNPLTFSTGLIETTTTYNIYGKISGGGLDFDGVDDEVDCGSGISLAATSFTLECWARRDATGDFHNLFGMGSMAANNGLHIQIQPGNNLHFGFWANDLDAPAGSYATDGQWHHYAFTYDSGTGDRAIYIDGMLAASDVSASDFLGTGNLFIGNIFPAAGAQSWEGAIDEARVWDVAKSMAEINANMYACLSGTESDLIACYHFEDGTGSATAADATGSFDGTLTSMDPATDWVTGTPTCADCDLELSTLVTVTIDDLADQTISTGDFAAACQIDTTIEMASSQAGAFYGVRIDSTNEFVSGPYVGDGGPITMGLGGPITSTTTFNVFSAVMEPSATALDFDGIDDYVSIPALDFTGTDQMTIEAKIRPVDITTNGSYEIVRQEGGGLDWIFSFQDNGTTLSFGLNTASGGYTELDASITPSYFTDGDWHHVAAVYDGTNKYVYVDGVIIGSEAKTGTITMGGAPVQYIGKYPFGSEYFYGTMDDIRIWNVARDSAGINDSINVCLTGGEAGLVSFYDMNDGTGSSVLSDGTINGNDGTLTNMDPATDWVAGDECFSCSMEMSDLITITIEPIADQTISTADFNAFCHVDTTIQIATSQIGANYFLKDTMTGATIDGPVAGDGGAVMLSTGPVSTTTGYAVYAGGGLNDGVLDFDGVNDYVDAGNTFGNFGTSIDFTIEAWVKYTGSAPNYAGIAVKGTTGAWTGFQLVLVNDKIAAEFASGGSYLGVADGLQGTTLLNDGTWHHVAMVVDRASTNAKLYVDGSVESDVTNAIIGNNLDNPAGVRMGTERASVAYFHGVMDEVRFWNVAKSGVEIMSNMMSCYDGSEAGFEALFKFEDGMGSSMATEAVAGNNGTLTNMDPSTDWVNGSVMICYGCDINLSDTVTITIDTLTSTTVDVNLCDGESVFAQGDYQTTTGMYNDTITSFYGCDSVVVTNLTVSSPDFGISVDLIDGGVTLTSNQAGATYQWIDCSDNSAIAGETNQSYTPAMDGSYAVILDDGICNDTSDCVTVKGVGIDENNAVGLTLAPNPTNGLLNVTINNGELYAVDIYNSLGQLVHHQELANSNAQLDLSKAERGIYQVRLMTSAGIVHRQLIKQ